MKIAVADPVASNTWGRPLTRALLVCASFAALFICYSFGAPLNNDSKWSIPASLSLIREHNYDINEYSNALERSKSRGRYRDTVTAEGRIYPVPSVGVSLAAVPFVMIYGRFVDVADRIESGNAAGIEHFVAAFYVMLTALFIYLICSYLIKDKVYAALLTFIFAFCTTAWSNASLALFQHGPSMLFLSVTLYLLLKARARPSLAQYAGASVAVAFVMRPSNIIPMALISLYVAWDFRKYFARFLMFAAVVVAPFLLFDFLTYGSLLPPYYTTAAGQTNTSPGYFLTGLAGNLISPARGLLIFSPVLVFSIVGAGLKIGKKRLQRLDYFLLAIVLSHWACISLFDPWWGGHSYGPRYFTDMLPLLIYFIVPAVVWIEDMKPVRQGVLYLVVLVLIGISFFANYQGTASDAARSWNVHPEIYGSQWRLWDWSDIPYLRTSHD